MKLPIKLGLFIIFILCIFIFSLNSSGQVTETSAHSSSDLIIEKKTLNGNEDGFFKNNPIYIMVKIHPENETHNDLEISEYVDPGLTITGCSPIIKEKIIDTDQEKSLQTQINSLQYSDIITSKSNPRDPNIIESFKFEFPCIFNDEIIGYVYEINAERTGSFSLVTEAKYSDDSDSVQCSKKEIIIRVSEDSPDFDLLFDLVKTEAECGEQIPISYSIEYTGGASCTDCSYDVVFDHSEKYDLSKPQIVGHFTKGFSTTLSNYIVYHEPGNYNLPGIHIGGKYFKPDQSIKIISTADKYINAITISLSSALIAFLTFITNIFIHKREIKMKKEIDSIREQLDVLSKKIAEYEEKAIKKK